ncbi:hypothetical protein [Thiolapillus sp.]|uniref:hypothetical protein n=2 Tax=Thiolapillus sp. TaxID=2017437 RepID=UPI003AF81865
MKNRPIKRRVARIDTSNQPSLFDELPQMESENTTGPEPATLSGVVFEDPDPKLIYLNAVRLDQHLYNAGQRGALKVRELLEEQVCLRPRDRFWDIPVPKIDSAFDNLFVPQPSWSPSTTQQLRKLVAAPYLSPNDWTPRLDAYFASPLALCARRVSSAASRLLGSTSLRFALHGWQRRPPRPADSERR